MNGPAPSLGTHWPARGTHWPARGTHWDVRSPTGAPA